MEETFEINGVQYKKKPEPPQRSHRRLPPQLMGMMLMAEMMYAPLMGSHTRRRESPNIDIVTEYGLIQQKKSRLSRIQREWVVSQFEKKFIKI